MTIRLLLTLATAFILFTAKAQVILKGKVGIERFTVDPAWRLTARFEPADSLHTIPVTNIIGQTTPQRCPGAVVFAWEGKTYRLDALDGGDDLFIIFSDATSGHETYGGGRFLYAPKPSAEGKVVLDFNKAYNPPCVFTPYATCPLPPSQNQLPIAVHAGEKVYGHHAAASL